MNDEVFCIWVMGEEHFGIQISKIASLYRGHIKSKDLGRSISGDFLGNAVPEGELVHAPIYFSEESFKKMCQAEYLGRQVILLSRKSEHVALIADRVLFVGPASEFKGSPVQFISPDDYFANKETDPSVSENVVKESLGPVEEPLNLLRYKINHKVFEMPVQDVAKVYSPKDLVHYRLLCDEAAGYIFGGQLTIPVLNLGADLSRHSSRVLVFHAGDLSVGVIVDEIFEISRSDGSPYNKLDIEGRFGAQFLGNLSNAYAKVFPSPAKSLAESQKKTSVMNLLKIDIGELVFVSVHLVSSIQPCADLDLNSKTYLHGDIEMPLIQLSKYYGFRERSDEENKHRRVLIVEHDGTHLALIADAVLEILQVDSESENQVMKWCLNNYSAKFQSDARGIINVADYRKNTFLNLIYLNFSSLLENKAA